MIKKPETINTIKINFFVSFFLKLLGMRSMQCSFLLFEKLNQCRHCPGTIIYKTPSIFSSWGEATLSNRKPQRYFYFYLCFQGIRSLVRKIKWGLRKSHVTPLLAVLLSRVLGMELFSGSPRCICDMPFDKKS